MIVGDGKMVQHRVSGRNGSHWEDTHLLTSVVKNLKWNHTAFDVRLREYLTTWSFTSLNKSNSRSQWPRGLRHRSAAARLLRLWVRIPPGAWMYCLLSVVRYQVEFSARGWSLVQRSHNESGVSVCDEKTSYSRPRSMTAVETQAKCAYTIYTLVNTP